MEIGTKIRQLRKERGLTLNQLATQIDSDVGNLSRLERGLQGYSQVMLEKLAEVLQVPVSALFDLDHYLPKTHVFKHFGDHNVVPVSVEENKALYQITEKRGNAREQPYVRSVTAFDAADGIPDEVVLVPESRIEFGAGDGKIHYELIEDAEPATYRRTWFQKYGINPDRARRFRVSGDSQEPYLFDRDTILVNLDETQVIDGKLYALRYGDQLRVKFLSKRLDGTLILRSINPAYKDEEIPAELANEHITVIGRVRDRSGTGGL